MFVLGAINCSLTVPIIEMRAMECNDKYHVFDISNRIPERGHTPATCRDAIFGNIPKRAYSTALLHTIAYTYPTHIPPAQRQQKLPLPYYHAQDLTSPSPTNAHQ